jgi:hypothetical protein
MPESSVERMRHALAKVETLLQELEPGAPVEVLSDLPGDPGTEFVAHGSDDPRRAVIGSTAVDGFVIDQTPHDNLAQTDPPTRDSADPASPTHAQARLTEARAEAAGELERLVVEARRVAERLYVDERCAAEAMLVEAQHVAERLHADEQRAADAVLIEAQRVAEQLQAEQSQAAGVLLIEAERFASEGPE